MKDNKFGVLLDMSRNSVMNVPALKRMIDYLSAFGYNTLLLYTEDVYEVDGEPFFGYGRGKYKKEELREIDSYGRKTGVEIIPCIQTLAHLNCIFKWDVYGPIKDIRDILLVDEGKTYELIGHMFDSIAECFSSRYVHIGMDEANLLGRGKYYDLHGDVNKFEIFRRHLERVVSIAKSYGFKPIMWSDMLFRISNQGQYYVEDMKTPGGYMDVANADVGLVYWDYYYGDEFHYDKMIEKHLQLGKDVWFAGGGWTWTGFAPNNKLALKTLLPALRACKKRNLNKIMIALWGDDGGECSFFSVLPVLFKAKKIYEGINHEQQIEDEFFHITGERFSDMLSLGCLNEISGNEGMIYNPSKYMFYNDPLHGLFDFSFDLAAEKEWKRYAKALKVCAGRSKKLSYLFNVYALLADFLSVKAGLGIRLRMAYELQNKKELESLKTIVQKASEKLNLFYIGYKELWYSENKPFGFEVQEIRIGGLMLRLRSCYETIENYLSGKISRIEELEEPLLDISADGRTGKRVVRGGLWKDIVTPNII